MTQFTKPKFAAAGPKGSKDLVDDHAFGLVECQIAINNLEKRGNQEGEDTDFMAIKDARFVTYSIRALLSSVVEEE